MARTAVVAGTATAVSNRVSRRQQGRWAQQETAEGNEQEQYAAPPSPVASAATGSGEDRLAQLTELGKLKESGVLTDAEFAAEKSKILNA